LTGRRKGLGEQSDNIDCRVFSLVSSEPHAITIPSMMFARLLLVSLTVVVICRAQESPSAAAGGKSEWREELRSEFQFHPGSSVTETKTTSQPAVDPNVVTLPPFIVRETREIVDLRSLHGDILQQEADAHSTAIMNKLGTGEYVKTLGKVDFGVATIFYIPVAFGFRF